MNADEQGARLTPWRKRQELPCPVDPACKVDHLRRKSKPRKKGERR